MATGDLDYAGRCVQERRTELGLRQIDVAQAAGIEVGTVSGLELGKHMPRPATRARIEDALGWRRGSLRDALGGLRPVLAQDAPAGPADELERRFLAIEGIEPEEAEGAAALVRSLRAARARREREGRRTGTGS